MRVAWDEICADTNCHPQDIIQHGRKILSFKQGHWSLLAGKIVGAQVVKLFEGLASTPCNRDAVVEECASVCDTEAKVADDHLYPKTGASMRFASRKIRALKSTPSPSVEGEQTDSVVLAREDAEAIARELCRVKAAAKLSFNHNANDALASVYNIAQNALIKLQAALNQRGK